MATLVLSTAGTMLGGPLGGAIGSLIGHSIDQQLLGPGPRRGPRLGDLSVQTSTYGTPVPRLYGTMRVAGTVIWATDLQESSTQTGAKGQPDTIVYSYSVSMAVALSSRRVRAIKRIWADGRLLRGAAGDFKVPTDFRFHDGSADQAVDPLIASVEGIGTTPAYRGLALAVFENLQLAEYGNRIPFLTFEVEADDGPVELGAIMADASRGWIESDHLAAVLGYAAHGDTIERAVAPLADPFGIELVDDGDRLRSPAAQADVQPSHDQLGSSAEAEPAARVERTQAAAKSLPSALKLAFYDPERDYQAGEARAAVGEHWGPSLDVELPAALMSPAAKALAETAMARRWAGRDRIAIALPPAFVDLAPGATLRLPDLPGRWVVERCTIEQLVVKAELRPAWSGVESVPADGGRSLPSPDVVQAPAHLALFELPDMDGSAPAGPQLVLAAASETGRVREALELELPGSSTSIAAPAPPTILGMAITALPPAQAYLLDLASTLEVELVSDEAWLQSCDDEALVAGANAMIAGSEIIQFGREDPIGAKRFRLSRLLRGRRGTEWAMALHAVGEPVAMLDLSAMTAISLPQSLIGATARVRNLDASAGASRAVSGEALRPPSPVHLRVGQTAGGGIDARWIRRSRLGWAWQDGLDAPLGEASETYRVELSGPGGRIEIECSVPEVAVTAAQAAQLGSGPVTLTVRQIGDRGVSHPAAATFNQP